MAERWKEIKQVDEGMFAIKQKKQQTQNEIEFLQNKLQNYDLKYNELYAHKQYLGKEIYGSSIVRGELIKSGLASSNSKIRESAHKLREQYTDIKWDKDVGEELIDICMYIDMGVTEINNWNISNLLYRIGKFGYDDINNF